MESLIDAFTHPFFDGNGNRLIPIFYVRLDFGSGDFSLRGIFT